MKVVQKNLNELHMMEQNIRLHTDRQIREYMRSVEMFGQTKPLVCDENGEIIIGNGLYRAFCELGRETIDCYVITGLTELQKKKMMLADNKIFEMGLTDDTVLYDIMEEFRDNDIPGYSPDILDAMIASVKETTEAVREYGTFSEEQKGEFVMSSPKPPVYTQRGGEFNQTEPIPQPEHPHQDSPFVICPKCGEKIYLEV